MFEDVDNYCLDLCSWVDSCKPSIEFDTDSLKAAVDNVTSYLGPNTRSMLFYGGCINSWNVSKVTSMVNLFYEKPKFNVNIASWITDKVTNMFVSCLFQIFIQIYSFYIFV